MTQSKSDGPLARAFDRLDALNAKTAGLEVDLGGVKDKMGTLVGVVGNLADKIERLGEKLTHQAAREGPGWMEILQGCAVIIGMVAGVSTAVGTGVSMYMSATYGGTITQLQSDVATAKADLAQRGAEDRAELIERRKEERLSMGRALEGRGGWTAAVAPEASAQ